MDMIMQMIYGRHLDMMGSRRHRWLAQALLDGNHYMYLCLASPTIFRSQVAHWLGFRDRFFPGMAHESQWFDAIAAELFDSRDTNHPASGGIVAAMRQAVDEKTGLSFEGEVVRKEAVMLARAGGDTTAVALAACFFYLSTDAVVYKRVTGEIRSTFDSMDDIFQTDNLSRCEYLIASIDEAMRLTPPVPGCLWRKVERDVMVDGRLVPRGTEVGVCQYALHRCHNLFPNPDHFEPQRFLKTTDHDVPPGAYTPFQHGPRACPARLLALRELRFALAQVLWQMDVRVFPLHAVNAVTGDSGVELKIEDIFSSKAKAQFLQFRPRSGLAV
ncbi:uncharacterized protein A1O9_12955 [Exophiala aquamarina CBS 119918]|uniref:Cytochrome P450 oxidoreductase n=1 Tax=Exophiala aquamarina CBS 119918 TaxID=1182545 RepID=A0A072NV93_9EURO|nr:uncharacterized protein A1O9_12955 [Exophiala aquamarina CBS 119918]KEF50978.1 hypothetical protein A1O9_12955 [Exophiala aquamarina CBS 119918]